MKDLITVIFKLLLGAIIFFLPLLIFAVVAGFIHIEFSFRDSVKWVIGPDNPLGFPFAIFYVGWAIWACIFTFNKIYE